MDAPLGPPSALSSHLSPCHHFLTAQDLSPGDTRGTRVYAGEGVIFKLHRQRPQNSSNPETGYANPTPPRMHWEPGNQEGGRRLS